METTRTYLVRAYANECDFDGYYPANLAAYAEGRLADKGHQSPVSDTETFRRFEVSHDGERLYITEGAPTRAYPLNWGFGRTTREGAWMFARTQHLPVTVELLDGTIRELGVIYDADEALRREYRAYVSQGMADSDGYFGPLTFEAWSHGRVAA